MASCLLITRMMKSRDYALFAVGTCGVLNVMVESSNVLNEICVAYRQLQVARSYFAAKVSSYGTTHCWN